MKKLKIFVFLFSLIMSISSKAQFQQNSCYNRKNNSSQVNLLGPYATPLSPGLSNGLQNKRIQKQWGLSNNAPYQLDTSYLYRCVSQSSDVIVTDSFYYMGGRTRYCGYNVILLPFINKIDLLGNLVWTSIDSLNFKNHFTNNSTNLLELSDGSLLKIGLTFHGDTLFGDTTENAFTQYNYVINRDKGNNLIYKKELFLEENEGNISVFTDAIALSKNKEYICVGRTSSNSYHPHPNYANYYTHDSIFVTIFKLDSMSNIINMKKFFIGTDKLNMSDINITTTHDNGYLIAGHAIFANDSNYNALYPRKYFIIKVDSNFNFQWMKKLGQTKHFLRNIINIIPSKTGGYLFAASYFDNWSATYPGRMWYGKLSENGDLLWSKKVFQEFDSEIISGTTIPYLLQCPMSIVENENGAIIIGGQVNFDAGPYIYKADSLGNKIFSRWLIPKFLHSSSYIRNMRQTKDKGFVFVGSQHEINAAGRSAMLIKTDSLGCLLPNCADTLIHLGIEEISKLKEQDLIVYPNPAQGTIQIAINKQGEKIEQIIIYDINGREVYNELMDVYLFSKNINSLSKGVYIIRVKGSKGSILNNKFVKQ